MKDALSGEEKTLDKDWSDIDCGCGNVNCPYCNPHNLTKAQLDRFNTLDRKLGKGTITDQEMSEHEMLMNEAYGVDNDSKCDDMYIIIDTALTADQRADIAEQQEKKK